MPFEKGKQLGPYEIVESLGAGGMGEVYKARDTAGITVVANWTADLSDAGP